MARLTLFRRFIATSIGVLITLAGCGGSSESDPVPTVSIDTGPQRTHDDLAQALASEHGAPGEAEPLRYVLVGASANERLAGSLRDRGFADVSVGAR